VRIIAPNSQLLSMEASEDPACPLLERNRGLCACLCYSSRLLPLASSRRRSHAPPHRARAPAIYLFFKYSYTLFLFPHRTSCTRSCSQTVRVCLRPTRKVKPMPLPPYPDPPSRDELFLFSESHDPRKPVPSVPLLAHYSERGLFTGIAIFGPSAPARPALHVP